jgi:hypothetical protein
LNLSEDVCCRIFLCRSNFKLDFSFWPDSKVYFLDCFFYAIWQIYIFCLKKMCLKHQCFQGEMSVPICGWKDWGWLPTIMFFWLNAANFLWWYFLCVLFLLHENCSIFVTHISFCMRYKTLKNISLRDDCWICIWRIVVFFYSGKKSSRNIYLTRY